MARDPIQGLGDKDANAVQANKPNKRCHNRNTEVRAILSTIKAAAHANAMVYKYKLLSQLSSPKETE